MVDGVHSDTSNSRESLSLSFEFVEQDTGLHDGLFVSSSSSDNTDGGSAVAGDGLSGAGWQSNSSFKAIIGVTNNGGVGS